MKCYFLRGENTKPPKPELVPGCAAVPGEGMWVIWMGMGGRQRCQPTFHQQGAGEGTQALLVLTRHLAHGEPLWPPRGGQLLASGTWQAQDHLQNTSRRLLTSWWAFVLPDHPSCFSFLFILSPPCPHSLGHLGHADPLVLPGAASVGHAYPRCRGGERRTFLCWVSG